MRWSIQSQLVVPILLVIVVLLTGGAQLAIYLARAAALQQHEARVQATAHVLQESSYPLTATVLSQVGEFTGLAFVMIPTLGPIQRSESSPDVSQNVFASVLLAADSSKVRLSEPFTVGGGEFRGAGLTITRRGVVAGRLYVLVPNDPIEQAAVPAISTTAVVGGIAGLVAILVVINVTRRVTRRLDQLAKHSQVIAQGKYEALPFVPVADEVADLTAALNTMAERLAEYENTLRRTERIRLLDQVGSGLAHQVRNGLAGAKLAIQAYQRENKEHAQDEALQVALRELRVLEERVRDFLSDDQRAGNAQTCELGTVCQTTYELFAPRCRHQGVELVWNRPTDAFTVAGTPQAWLQVIINLVDNAVHAVAGRGQVTINLADAEESAPENIRLTVTDSGPGPPAELRDRLFEPFVTGRPDGIGLGLAVVKRVVGQLRGTISWRCTNKQTVFEVSVPRSPSDVA